MKAQSGGFTWDGTVKTLILTPSGRRQQLDRSVPAGPS
jgi:hypothetical protein